MEFLINGFFWEMNDRKREDEGSREGIANESAHLIKI